MFARRQAGMVDRLEDMVSRRRVERAVRLLARWTSPSSRILDMGCGSGALGHALESELGYSSVYNVDVVDRHRFPLQRYLVCDIAALPFSDQRFDVTTLGFVLHPMPDAQKIAVLREAARVTRGHILVLEDTPEHLVDHALSWVNGLAWRMRSKGDGRFVAHSQDRWRAIFASLGLEVLAAERLCRLDWPGVPSGRSCFLLGRAKAPAGA